MCLASVTKNIQSDNLAVSSCCLRTTGALINVLGPRALPELPSIMENVLRRSNVFSSVSAITTSGEDNASIPLTDSKESLYMSVFLALEAVVDNLGGFLNPYLGDILKLVVLHPKYASGSDPKLKFKADVVRKLITEKVPVRLLLPPLLSIYSKATEYGDSSLSIAFKMLGNLVRTIDRSSIAAYRAKIFDLCLLALDLRRQHLVSIRSIDIVEKNVINTMIFLTMKLTETMFKPLFIRCIEWAESNVDESESVGSTSVDRAITFYGLVNKLAESHRSATVDSDLFSRYFGRCPVITAQGRTHPVSTHFLEDIYESINYLLALDSSTCLRDDTSTKKNDLVSNHRGKKNLVLSGWGDESILSEDFINPYYIQSTYQTYSDQTRKNLRRLNEDVIDYDLLKDLVHYIDETHPKGAILVFLPMLTELEKKTSKIQGVMIEDNRFCISVHYRHVHQEVIMGSFIADGGKESKAVNQMEQLSAPSKLAPVGGGGGATGATSPPSHGTLSESSGGPGSPLNHSTGAYNNSNPQGMSTMPWR